MDKKTNLYEYIKRVQEKEPHILCITNFVTVNDCANILLAAGASPFMSDWLEDAADNAEAADALVCNLGSIEKAPVMKVSGKRANEVGRPVVLDPIGAGGSVPRRAEIASLMQTVKFASIRGNASEIRALAVGGEMAAGVDVKETDKVTEANLASGIEMVKACAKKLDTVVAISGVIDLVSDGEKTAVIRNGCATMARITGSGCMLTSLVGAMCAGSPDDAFGATCAAVALMGVAGEIAEEKRLANGTGNSTFRNDLIDAVFNMTEEQFKEKANYEIF